MSGKLGDCCVALPRIAPSSYKRKGVYKTSPGGLSYYESSIINKHPDVAVLGLYDIMGPELPNLEQQTDRISSGLGVKVLLPDWFAVGHGYPGDLGGWASKKHGMWKWLDQVIPPEKLKERINDMVAVLEAEGVKRIALVGFCWGAITAVDIVSESDRFCAAGLIHGMEFTAEQAVNIKVPIFNLPSKDEGLQPEFQAALPAGTVRDKSRFKLFNDVGHGFAAGRGDWERNSLLRRRAEEVIEDYVRFIQEVVLDA